MSYEDDKAQIKEDQETLTREEVAEMLRKKNEHVFDPETAPKLEHRWVDRGLKMSCEGASHPMHQSYKHQAIIVGATKIVAPTKVS